MEQSVISIKKISKAYKGVLAIDAVSLDLNQGEIFGFIGPNGAGKSTTIKVLLNYILADSGTAVVSGFDSVSDNKEIKKRVGYVSSEVNFYPEMSALEIIKLSMRLHDLKEEMELNRLIDLFLIEKNKKIKNMSLGNKKKVGIVSALVLNTPILILDEPTNGLDPLMQNVLFKELKRRASLGHTIFVSSHNLQEVQDHCDRVAFIKGGKIIQIVKMSETLTEGKYVRVRGEVQKLLKLDKHILMERENEMSFIFKGEISLLISTLSHMSVDNLIIENLSLEHQFLGYYNEGEQS